MTVRVYTKPQCSQCVQTTRLLDREGVPYVTESLLDEGNLAAAKELGHTSAPVVVVGEDNWSGFRPDLINELVKTIEGKA